MSATKYNIQCGRSKCRGELWKAKKWVGNKREGIELVCDKCSHPYPKILIPKEEE